MEVIGKEDGSQGGNKHGEGNTGAAGVRDRQSQARTCAREVLHFLSKQCRASCQASQCREISRARVDSFFPL